MPSAIPWSASVVSSVRASCSATSEMRRIGGDDAAVEVRERDQLAVAGRAPGDRVPVRAGRGQPHRAVEAVDDRVGERDREAVGLDVGGRPVEGEHVDEPPLDHAVPSHDRRRGALAGRR